MTKRLLDGSSGGFQNFSFPDSTRTHSLPVEVVKLIGTFLDAVSLVAFAFTCKSVNQITDPRLPTSKFCAKAAELGYLNLVHWGIDQNWRWTTLASAAAAKRGYLSVLQRVWDQGHLGFEQAAIGAAEGNQAAVLEWLYKKGWIPNADQATAAASHGHIELFKELKSKLGSNLITSAGEEIHPQSIRALIESGDLKALEALLGEIPAATLEDEMKDYLVFAAQVGNLEGLKFLLNKNVVDPDYGSIVQTAASRGQIHILEYILLELHKRDAFNEKNAQAAASNEQWDVVQWLIVQNIKGNEEAACFAAKHNRMKELELMHSAGWRMTNAVCEYAAVHGSWDLVKLLIGKGLVCEEYLLYFCAAKQGRIDLLNEIKAKKIPIAISSEKVWIFLSSDFRSNDQSVHREYAAAIGAAWSGKLETLHWVVEQGFKWEHEIVALAAVHEGHLEILKWLFQKNCPYESEELYRVAVNHSHMHIIEWMIELPVKTRNPIVSWFLARNGKSDLVKKLVEQGCGVNSPTLCEAAKGGHWDIFDWLIKTGGRLEEADLGSLLMAAAKQGKEEILSFLLRHHIESLNKEKEKRLSFLLMHHIESFNKSVIFDSGYLRLLAQDGYWKIFRDVITWCINKGICDPLEFVKAEGYGFDIKAATQAAYACAERGDMSALNWLKENHYLT